MAKTLPAIIETITAPTHDKIDREAGVVYGVKLAGQKSKNGNFYERKALEDLSELLEGNRVCYEHKNRKQRDFNGITENTRLVEEGGDLNVYGDWKYNRKHKDIEQTLEDIERFPRNLAMSIEIAKGRNYEKGSPKPGYGTVIKRIHKIRPTAIVDEGGINKGIFESLDEEPGTENEMSISSVKDLFKEYPELMECACTEAKEGITSDKVVLESTIADLTEKLEKVTADLEVAQGKLDEQAAIEANEAKRSEIVKAVADAGKDTGEDREDGTNEVIESLMAINEESSRLVLINALPEIKEQAGDSPAKKRRFVNPSPDGGAKKKSFKTAMSVIRSYNK